MAGKGEKNGVCNRSACDNAPAIHFNYGTDKFYCTSCARRINELPDCYGRALCLWVTDEDMDEDGIYLRDDYDLDAKLAEHTKEENTHYSLTKEQ